MKIVHVALYGPVTDGWNYQDNMLPKYQVKDGNEVTVIASKWVFNVKGELEYFDKTDYDYEGIKMIRLDLKVGKTVQSKIKIYAGLYERLQEERPECLFVHNVGFIDTREIVRYAKEYPVRIYADNHNDFSNSGRNWLSRNILHKILWRHYAQKLEPYTVKFYGVLPARVDFLIDIYGISKEKCELLVMGAEDELADQAEDQGKKRELRQQYGVKEEEFLIVTGGKIDESKKQTLSLMEAVRKSPNSKVKLILFGSVAQGLQQAVTDLCDGEKVQYAGWIDSAESYQYFAAADLVAFPGRHSVFWEQAAGQGKPMMCKFWAGTTHIDIGGNVIFLYEDSVREIQEKLTELWDDPEKFQNMKAAAGKEARKQFLYGTIARNSIGGKE